MSVCNMFPFMRTDVVRAPWHSIIRAWPFVHQLDRQMYDRNARNTLPRWHCWTVLVGLNGPLRGILEVAGAIW